MAYDKNLRQLDDASIIKLYAATSDKVYVGILFERYTHLVFGVCMKYLKNEDEAKDAVMTIFENLLTDLKRHEITYFKAWLHTVTKNHCFMILRNLKRNVEFIDAIYVENQEEEHQEDKTILEEKLTLLESAIKELDQHQQTCIRLFYLEKKSYYQIMEVTGFDFNKVKSFIQNGKRNLKIYMEKNESR